MIRHLILTAVALHSISAAIVQKPTNKIYERNKDLIGIMDCVINSASPSTAVYWLKRDAGIIHPVNGNSKYAWPENYQSTGNYSLIINNLDENDSGFYTCQVLPENDIGNAELIVGDAPKVQVGHVGGQQSVLKGDPFTLNCSIYSDPPITEIIWKKDGIILTENSTLLPQNGLEKDSEYSCQAKNFIGSSESKLLLTVHYAPVITIDQGESVTLNEGEELSLVCRADAVPVATFLWKKDGGDSALTTSPEYRIPKVRPNDSGLYRCIATNTPIGITESRNQTVSVTVNFAPGKPTISVVPDSSSGIWEVGTRVELNCNNSLSGLGSPNPTYSWFLDGKLISTNVSYILETSAINDTGKYSCETANSVGTSSSDVKSLAFHGPPELVSASSSAVNVSAGEKVLLSCSFRGLPKPNVIWYHNKTSIFDRQGRVVEEHISQSGAYIVVLSTLLFEEIDVVDIGSYSCMTVMGSEASNFSVRVKSKPSLNGHAKVAVDIGETAQLTCNVRSYPPVTDIMLLMNDQEIANSTTVIVHDIKYNVSGLEYQQTRSVEVQGVSDSDYGVYQCRAVNEIGQTTFNITLQKPGPPDAPSNFVVHSVNWDSFSVTWDEGFDGGKPQQFFVYWNSVRSNASNQTQYQVNDLLPDTNYVVLVEAKNELGATQTNSLTLTTLPYTVPIPTVAYDSQTHVLTVSLANSTGYCIIIEASNDDKSYQWIDNACYEIEQSRTFQMQKPYSTYYRAKACVVGRAGEVCSVTSNVAKSSETNDEMPVKYIVLAIVLTLVGIVIIIVVTAVICACRKKKKIGKPLKKPPSPITGPVTEVIVNDETAEAPYSTYYPTNNDLNLGGPNTNATDSGAHDNDCFNYEYAVVRKSSIAREEKKLNNYESMHDYSMQPQLSPQDSNSDNTEANTMEEIPASLDPYSLSEIIGDNPPYKRFHSPTESGYSTPDSKALKKIIYEAIV